MKKVDENAEQEGKACNLSPANNKQICRLRRWLSAGHSLGSKQAIFNLQTHAHTLLSLRSGLADKIQTQMPNPRKHHVRHYTKSKIVQIALKVNGLKCGRLIKSGEIVTVSKPHLFPRPTATHPTPPHTQTSLFKLRYTWPSQIGGCACVCVGTRACVVCVMTACGAIKRNSLNSAGRSRHSGFTSQLPRGCVGCWMGLKDGGGGGLEDVTVSRRLIFPIWWVWWCWCYRRERWKHRVGGCTNMWYTCMTTQHRLRSTSEI